MLRLNNVKTYTVGMCNTVLVMYTVDVPLVTVISWSVAETSESEALVVLDFLSVLVLSVSIAVSRSRAVERSIVSTVFVIILCIVCTYIVPGPVTVAKNSTVVGIVRVFVTTLTCQTSW